MNKLYVFAFLILLLFIPRIYRIKPIAVSAQEKPATGQNGARIAHTKDKQTYETSNVESYIVEQAKIYGVDPLKALWIVRHESQDGQRMQGDDGQSLGFWMISTVYHPEVPRKCSLNLVCSTQWSLTWIKKGNINQWSTWRLRRKLYPNDQYPD